MFLGTFLNAFCDVFFHIFNFSIAGLEHVAGLLLGSKLKKKLSQPFDSKCIFFAHLSVVYFSRRVHPKNSHTFVVPTCVSALYACIHAGVWRKKKSCSPRNSGDDKRKRKRRVHMCVDTAQNQQQIQLAWGKTFE